MQILRVINRAKSTSLVDYAGSLLCCASPMFLPLLTCSPTVFQIVGHLPFAQSVGGVWVILAPSLPGQGWWRPKGQNPRAETQPNPAPSLVQKEQVITKWNKKRNTQKEHKKSSQKKYTQRNNQKKEGRKNKKRYTPEKTQNYKKQYRCQ